MTGPAMRPFMLKAALAAFFVLCAAASLAVLATASVGGDGGRLVTDARPLEHEPLGR